MATTLWERAEQNCSEEISKYLQSGGDINALNDRGESLLFLSVTKNDFEALILLINSNIDVNVQERQRGRTALMVASTNESQEDVMSYLLTEGQVDVNLQDFEGKTALHYACIAGNLGGIRLLLSQTENQADIDIRENT
mmetsp:Transcript_52568/g.90440  ORF Transcript_52568/g.90440 Transcript_52568/m.90440 type:complete len:139 (-) Transcript_52568:218-634(-)|eukprot:CAMPEP_0194562574 /NCGR_PEP_ID=MMETSP0292-20121207/2970_1 /TAXON_ID=39354 /ORGANISM="Heterosigma akashiwo, Strain CCMP2393" /LENGTH=138 /DNA_ID=CAMNT_0039411321 /DNA_START=360 /DNA_END=776 /DNA_ORIENTATION=-